MVEYLSSDAIVDMDIHTRPDGEIDPDAFERQDLQRIGMPKEIVLRHRLPQFSHLFSSDNYSAGYYSYVWSAVDGRRHLESIPEAGRSVRQGDRAARMREFTLAPGNSTDRAEAFRQFRGRDPDVNAYLEDRGFPPAERAARTKTASHEARERNQPAMLSCSHAVRMTSCSNLAQEQYQPTCQWRKVDRVCLAVRVKAQCATVLRSPSLVEIGHERKHSSRAPGESIQMSGIGSARR